MNQLENLIENKQKELHLLQEINSKIGNLLTKKTNIEIQVKNFQYPPASLFKRKKNSFYSFPGFESFKYDEYELFCRSQNEMDCFLIQYNFSDEDYPRKDRYVGLSIFCFMEIENEIIHSTDNLYFSGYLNSNDLFGCNKKYIMKHFNEKNFSNDLINRIIKCLEDNVDLLDDFELKESLRKNEKL